MIANTDIEEIQLTATHVDELAADAGDQPRRFRFELAQSNPSRGIEKRIGVGSDGRLYFDDRAIRHHHRFDIALASLDPEPRKQLRIAKAWGYIALSLLLITLLHVFIANTTFEAYIPYPLIPAGSLSAALCAASLLGMIYQSRYQYCYRTRHGDVELIVLLYGRPTRERFRDFLARLSGSIRSAQHKEGDNADRLLANELREHRQLMEAGILSSDVYESAKERILARHGR